MEDDELNFERLLGRGAFGEVWLARDRHKRPFAIKFFNGDNHDLRDRITLEHANALIRVNHSGVVRVFGIRKLVHPDRSTPQIAIVMEYINGPPLAQFRGELTLEQGARFSTQLAEGLHAVHEAGLVHDDLHSGNVIVTPECAKLVDPMYTRSQADVGPTTRSKTMQDDVRDLSGVIRELLQNVRSIDPRLLTEVYYEASQSAKHPLEALRIFSSIWQASVSSVPVGKASPRREVSLYGPEILLAISRVDDWGTTLYTRVIDSSGVVATLPGLFVATANDLLEKRMRMRTLSILREDILESWREGGRELVPSDFEQIRIADPVLVSLSGGQDIILADAFPEAESRQDLFAYERSVGVQGKIGPFLMIEQADYTFGGGAHGGVGYSSLVIDLERCQRVESLLTPDEVADVLAREGRVAQASFALRDDERLFDEVEIELASIIPMVHTKGQSRMGVRCLFTTGTSFAQSDHRWTSYTISETVTARRLPAVLQPYESVPPKLSAIMREQAGDFVGWSLLTREHPAYSRLLEEIARVSLAAPDLPPLGAGLIHASS